MSQPIQERHLRPLLDAVALAARAHQGQIRKDGKTPYASHVFRVCLIVRHVFGVDDTGVLTAAVLHDTIEDTTTDYDDLEEKFGAEVAGWVAALTKDMRLPYDEREARYVQALTDAPWQVQVAKLADILDNTIDVVHLSQQARERGFRNKRRYLDAIHAGLKPEARPAWEIAAGLFNELDQSAGQGA